MRRIILFLLAFCFLAEQTCAAAIHRIALDSNNPDNTQYTIEIDRGVHYHPFSLHHPERFVIDFNNVSNDSHITWPGPDGDSMQLVTAVRHTLNPHTQSMRVVFDMRYPTSVSVTIQPLSNQHMQLRIRFKHRATLSPVSTPPAATATREPAHTPTSVVNAGVAQLMENMENNKSWQPVPAPHGRDVVIVIDPGHGGKDPGATGLGGRHEKDIVLRIAQQLQEAINQQPGFTAYLTRKGDYYISLRERLAIARKYKADMFIAVHADAHMSHEASGAAVYALSLRGATSEATRWLANQENASELMGGVDLNDKSNVLKSVLLNLSQTATLHASLRVGKNVIHTIGEVGRLHHPNVEQAAFVVLKSPDIPSLLIETGFISNPSEEAKLINTQYQIQLANAIMRGVQRYFFEWPPHNTALQRYGRNDQKKYNLNNPQSLFL